MAALIGLALSATCGFRVFVPLLAVCIATRAEKTEGETYVQLAENFSWLASDPAFVVFLVAAIFEIAGYYLPIIDNFLDTLATPAAVVAGTVLTASLVGDASPFLRWSLAIIAGGGSAADDATLDETGEWTTVYAVTHTLATPLPLARNTRVVVEVDCRRHSCNAAVHNVFFRVAV